MTASDTTEFNGVLEQFEGRTNGYFRFYKGDDLSKGVTISFPHWRIPRQGTYTIASFDLELTYSTEWPRIEDVLTPGMSRTGCRADLVQVGDESWRFSLQNPEDRSDLGLMYVSPSLVPEWLEEDNEKCFTTIRLEYRHERSKEEYGLTDGNIEQKRAQVREQLENE